MPMYDYSCTSCGTAFEELRKVSESQQGVPCPACGAEARRVFSAPSFLSGGLSRSVPEWRAVPGGKPINQYTKL